MSSLLGGATEFAKYETRSWAGGELEHLYQRKANDKLAHFRRH